jgi:hypothetical protein
MQNTKRRGRGRPTRAEAAGIDPSTVDPRRVLAQVAADVSAPASARVTAAKALLEDEIRRADAKANEAAMAEYEAKHPEDELGLEIWPKAL